jgi:dihydrofolate synthase/folylpolyglutamate synthase
MSVTEDLDRWLSQLSLHSVDLTANEKLQQTRAAARQLNLLPWNKTVITVGGTNGKGSVVACLESILVKAGYRVGTFTSPHLFHFNERISINQNSVNNEAILNAFKKIALCTDVQLSYFQYAFLAALIIFKQSFLDIIILEVGIGGRYDAVNVIDADVAVIASVDLDHCEILGNDRETIGYDKAGIMRSKKPVICGDNHPPKSLIDYANKIGAKLYLIGQDFKKQSLNPLPSILPQNIASAIMAIRCLPTSFLVSERHIADGLNTIQLKGRRQLIEFKNRKIIFDVSHNAAATKELASYLKTLTVNGKIYAITGMMKDKDIHASLKNMISRVDRWAITPLNTPRSASVDQLMSALKNQAVDVYKNAAMAFEDVLQKANKNDLMVVFGSFILVSDLLKRF